MTLFVTGGAGFIGSEFIRQAIQKHRIINFDKLTYAGNLDNLASVAGNPSYSLVVGDICDAPAVAAALPENCDAIVHFAAESHVDRSILSAEEFVRTNVVGTQVMLDVARHRKAGRFLHISTDEVGGDMPPDGWFREEDALKPNSPYAASKTSAEHFVRAAAHTFGLDVLITRTAITTGLISSPRNCCRWPFRTRSKTVRSRCMAMACKCATGSTWPIIAGLFLPSSKAGARAKLAKRS